MKKIILSTGVMILSITCFAQNNSAGNVFIKSEMFPVTGKSFTIGSQKSVDKVLESFKAYNSKDFEKYISLSVLTDQEKAFQKNWFNSLTKVEEKPWVVFPLRLEGTKEEVVFTIAEEDREYKNGSKQKLFVVELNKVNEEGKLTDFLQFKSIPANSEFGKTSGGKFLGRIQNENRGKPFVFSNRGELKVIEKMVEDVNNLDITAIYSSFADKITFNSGEGGKDIIMTKQDLEAKFATMNSIEWNPISIIPIKIADTDPASGVIVYSTYKIIYKNGKTEERDLMETYYFDLNGKINSVNQFSKRVTN
jgi:hypothetical protein|uniref:hypothetical protein n=1 Tax=Algoriphagus sp. TaxID=1872435 RepID=UPI004048272E